MRVLWKPARIPRTAAFAVSSTAHPAARRYFAHPTAETYLSRYTSIAAPRSTPTSTASKPLRLKLPEDCRLRAMAGTLPPRACPGQPYGTPEKRKPPGSPPGAYNVWCTCPSPFAR